MSDRKLFEIATFLTLLPQVRPRHLPSHPRRPHVSADFANSSEYAEPPLYRDDQDIACECPKNCGARIDAPDVLSEARWVESGDGQLEHDGRRQREVRHAEQHRC